MNTSIRAAIFTVLAGGLWNCSEQPNKTSKADNSHLSVAVNNTAEQWPKYQTLVANPADRTRQLSISGRLQPLEQQQVVPEVSGKALPTKKILNEGVRYRRGEPMVRVDDTRYKLDLASQKSQFQASLVRIMSQIKLDYADAHETWDQYLRSLDRAQLLPVLPEVTDDQLLFFLSANNVFAQYYAIKSAEELLPKYEIKAPFTGVVISGNLSAGAVVNGGVPVAVYSRSDVYELRAAVSTTDVNRFKANQRLELMHAATGETWEGVVHRLAGTVDPGSQSIPLFIRVSGRHLREGMFLEATLESDRYQQVVVLPLTALNRSNQVHCIIDSIVVLKEVVPVYYDKDSVWVTGLQQGDQVIIEELFRPIAGSKALART